MAKIGEATVDVGDVLRQDVDDREGTVSKVDGDNVTLTFPPLPFVIPGMAAEATLAATSCYYNSWDAKFAASGKQPPVRQPTDTAAANADVLAAYNAQEEAEAAQAKAAVDAARAEAEALASKVEADQKAAAKQAVQAATAEAVRVQALVDSARAEGAALALNSTEVQPDNVPTPVQEPEATPEVNDTAVTGEVQPPEAFHEAEEV